MTTYKTIVGIDPDSKAHGVAIWRDGMLSELQMLTTIQVYHYLKLSRANDLLVSIENVLKQNFVYTRNAKASKAAHAKVALSVGRCQQAQQELMNWLDHLGVKYVLHPPQAANWAKNRAYFAKVTGWTKQSNEDTRSAAYFGFLEARKWTTPSN